MAFSALGLGDDVLRGAQALGFASPTPIQLEAIPPAVAGRDIIASAMTGSGKTAAFALPILQRLNGGPRGATRALVLTPTRELAAQIHDHFRDLGRHTRVGVATVIGGVGFGSQQQALRRGVDVIVATPGRLLDHMRAPQVSFRGLEVLVLDEADRMLDMGFLPDIRRILRQLPTRRQTLLFSATMPAPIVELAGDMLQDPVRIAVERPAAPATGVTQAAYAVPAALKPALLLALVRQGDVRSVIAFTRTKQRANRLAEYLERHGVEAGRLHGNRSQAQRTQTLGRFKAGKFPVLVATDLAARGIDVEQLSHVVNFDVPASPEDYVHRVGRTGRNQATGDAFLFVAPDEEKHVRGIERVLGRRIPRVTLPGFDYSRTPAEAPFRPAHARPSAAPRRPEWSDRGRQPRRGRGPGARAVAGRGGRAAAGARPHGAPAGLTQRPAFEPR